MSGNVLLKHPGPQSAFLFTWQWQLFLPLASSSQAFCFLSSLSLLSCFQFAAGQTEKNGILPVHFCKFQALILTAQLLGQLTPLAPISEAVQISFMAEPNRNDLLRSSLLPDQPWTLETLIKIFMCSHLRGLLAFVSSLINLGVRIIQFLQSEL